MTSSHVSGQHHYSWHSYRVAHLRVSTDIKHRVIYPGAEYGQERGCCG